MEKVRTSELYESCKLLGIQQENVFVHSNSDLPDSMDVRWPLEIISKHIIYLVEVKPFTSSINFSQ